MSQGATVVELDLGPITRTDIVRFAGASGDFNPLHHDEEHARLAGNPSVFSMGQMQAGMLSRLAADQLGLGAIRTFRVRFTAKVWPGDVLSLRGHEEARRGEPDGGERLVDWIFEAVRQDGEVAVRAWATAVVDAMKEHE